jgi:hypothetical protein
MNTKQGFEAYDTICSWLDSENHINLSFFNGNEHVKMAPTAKQAPGMCAIDNNLILTWTGGAGNDINVGSYFPYSNSEPLGQFYNGGSVGHDSLSSPKICVMDNQPVVFWRGRNSDINYAFVEKNSDGIYTGLGEGKSLGHFTEAAPQAIYFEGTYYIFWTGSNSTINYGTLHPQDGHFTRLKIERKGEFHNTTDAVCAVSDGSLMKIFWRGIDKELRVADIVTRDGGKLATYNDQEVELPWSAISNSPAVAYNKVTRSWNIAVNYFTRHIDNELFLFNYYKDSNGKWVVYQFGGKNYKMQSNPVAISLG